MAIPVLLISDGIAHPSLMARFWLRWGLNRLPGTRFYRVASLEALPHLRSRKFQAMVLYVHHQTISPAALAVLEALLREGKGLLALHSASASFNQVRRYHEILGGQFVEHGPIETFRVQPIWPAEEMFHGIPSFSVQDELYRHEYDPDNKIHFFTIVDREREPVVWTRQEGRGRVCYCALGHTTSSMRHPQVRQILQRSLAWICGTSDSEEAIV